MKSTTFKIYEIAEMVGYQNPEHFSRVFKKYVIERFNFRGKKVVVGLFFLGMLIPTFVTEIASSFQGFLWR